MRDQFYYEIVANEIDSGRFYNALWTRAFADASGDKTKAKAIYTKLRVKQLRQFAARSVKYPRTNRKAEFKRTKKIIEFEKYQKAKEVPVNVPNTDTSGKPKSFSHFLFAGIAAIAACAFGYFFLISYLGGGVQIAITAGVVSMLYALLAIIKVTARA